MNFTPRSIFSFQDTIGRLEYFVKSILLNVPLIVLFLLLALLSEESVAFVVIGGLLTFVVGIAIFIAVLALVFQRLNDLEQSKWLILLGVIPIINFIFGLYLLFAAGKSNLETSTQEETHERATPPQDLEETEDSVTPPQTPEM